MQFTPRVAGAVALLALVPVVVYGLSMDAPAAAVTAVNVLLISASLYLLTAPTEAEHAEESAAPPGAEG
jgi:hypothetical protein